MPMIFMVDKFEFPLIRVLSSATLDSGDASFVHGAASRGPVLTCLAISSNMPLIIRYIYTACTCRLLNMVEVPVDLICEGMNSGLDFWRG